LLMSIGDCIEWEGRKSAKGYGLLGKGQRAHRVAYERAKGRIPRGMVIMHTCDNPGCVNPAHLVAGTHKDNVHDCINKGRRRYASRDSLPSAKLTSEHRAEIFGLRKAGWSVRKLAERLGVSKSTVHAFICSHRSGTVAAPRSKKMVGVEGFEPPTSSSRTRCPY
jgi:hypothetical protein